MLFYFDIFSYNGREQKRHKGGSKIKKWSTLKENFVTWRMLFCNSDIIKFLVIEFNKVLTFFSDFSHIILRRNKNYKTNVDMR